MSPSVFSCRRFAVALLVRCAEVGESRLQRPKANLSRWNLKVTTQAAGPGIWPVEARVSLEGHDSNEKGDRRGCALRMRWASRGVVSRHERARIDGPPTKPGRVLIRAFAVPRGGSGREGEGVVRGPGCFNKNQFYRQPTRNQREIGSWMAEKVAEGGLRVEGSILGAENRWSLRVSRGGVVGGAGVVRDGGGGVLLSAKKQRLRACRKLINECCLMGYSRAEFAPVGWGEEEGER